MEMGFRGCVSEIQGGEEEMLAVDDLRKGPWTDEEDTLLFNYVTSYGEGRWNSVAVNTGLKRTGKSCRLRWLNYLRPDLRRGNITLEEQLQILKLHSRWGNRWSKIAKHIPGRTDNEIKNYWRTRVQKQAKHLKCDVNSQQFRDMLRDVFIPRLMEKISASKANTADYTESDNQIGNRVTGNMLMPEASISGVFSESWDTHVSPLSDLTESTYSTSGYECIENSRNLFRESSTWPEFEALGGYLDTVPAQPGSGVPFVDQNNNNHWLDGGNDQLFDIESWNEESLRLLSQKLFEEDL